MKVACVVLAAGGSTRLGSPKQQLAYHGRTLLRRAVDAALATRCRPVVVVLGAGADRLRGELAGLDVRIAENAAWERGMGSSVRLGMTALGDGSGLGGVLLTLCDQPLVGPEMLERLLEVWNAAGSCTIAAASYNETLGVPAVFGRGYFAELATLPDGAGARPILRRHAASVSAVSMPEAAIDIDTLEQYEALRRGAGSS